MKKVFTLILSILLLFSLYSVSFAYYEYDAGERTSLIIDNALLIDDYDEAYLLEKLEEISNTYQCEIAVLTVNSTNGRDITSFADDYYDYNGYGYGEEQDGMLLVVDMGSREYAITTYGMAIDYFNDYNLSVLEDNFVPYLSDADYYEAFSEFAATSEHIMFNYNSSADYSDGSYITDDDYYYDNSQDFSDEYYYDENVGFSFSLETLIIPIVIGILIALFYTSHLKGQLKTVESKASAKDYVVPGSLQLTHQRDIFMHKNVSRRAKPQKSSSSGSSTHSSSSGRSHGGSSGRF